MMVAGLSGAVGRTTAAFRHMVLVCVGADETSTVAVLAVACAVCVVCDMWRAARGSVAGRLRAAVPALAAALLLRGLWPSVVRLVAVQLLLSAAAGRLLRRQRLLWTLLSLLLAGLEVCAVAARRPAVPALLLAVVTAALVERCAEWRRTALSDCPQPLPLGAPAVSPPQRPPSLWGAVLRPPDCPFGSTGPLDSTGPTATDGGDEPGAPVATVLRACLPLLAAPVLLLLTLLCEWTFPWDAMVFHSRSSPGQLLQLVVMWTGQQALWLCPLITLQTVADIVLR